MSKQNPFIKFYGAKSKFVYYDSLQQTHPEVYNKILDAVISHSESHESKMLSIAAQMRAMASIEGAKEIALLRNFFSVSDIGIGVEDLYTSKVGLEIVNAINTALQFKTAYERHLTRIIGKNDKGGHAKVTAAQFFAQYFTDKLYNLIDQAFNSITNISDYSIEEIGDIIFSDEIINEALYQAFFDTEKSLMTSGDWSKNDSNHGYQDLFSAIEKFNKESFLREVSQAYKLDDLKNRLMESVKETGQLDSIFSSKQKAKSYLKKQLKETTTAKGTLAEILGEKAAATIVNGVDGASGKFSSKVIGSAGGKADIVMTFNLDISKILDVVDKHYSGREETVDAYKQLGKYLEKMNDGFIVYTNAKDYSLVKDKGNGGYFFQGFSAGSAISLRALEGVISNTPGGSAEIIGQIMSTMEGAIWSDQIGLLEEELISKMSYFLFDDVLTIGKLTAASSKAIHLTLLDGVYIPLSYLLFLMAEAIEDVAQEPSNIFDITIEPGKIAYPEPHQWTPGAWTSQKEIAYDQIKIGAKFLRNFVDVVSGLRM